MKTEEIPWSKGALFICSKCGKAFDRAENAEDLKKDLRKYLKESEHHKDIRVVVSGCLDICDIDYQAVSYHPVDGKTEVITVSKDYELALQDLKDLLRRKL